jgi:hypothetical protein
MPPPAPAAGEGFTIWRYAVAVIVVTALGLRLCNLGTSSVWLDEVFTLMRASLPIGETLASCARNAENVPLYAVMTHISLRLGLDEPWFRLVPISAAVLSIPLFGVWSRRHFGATAALIVAGLSCLSTFHVRYSQELRAYPYLLLVTSLALLAADRLRTRPDLASVSMLATVVAVGWYTHLSFALVLFPIAGAALFSGVVADGGRAAAQRPAWTHLLLAVAAGTAAFVPWFVVIARALQPRLSQGEASWSLKLVARRWQFLTVAVNEGDPLTWLGVTLAVFGAVGVVVAIRHRTGRAVLIPAVVMLFISEAAMVFFDHFSRGRYNTALWPFLVILVAVGVERCGRLVRSPIVRVAAGVVLVTAMLVQVDGYHRRGRPRWDRMVEAVEQLRRPGEPVLTENTWGRMCVEHYMGGSVESLDRKPERLLMRLDSEDSVLLLTAGYPRSREIRVLAKRSILLLDVPLTGRLYRIQRHAVDSVSEPDRGRATTALVWPRPAPELVPDRLLTPVSGCLGRWLSGSTRSAEDRDTARFEFERRPTDELLVGWSRPKTWDDGTTFAWVIGREAAVILRRTTPAPARIGVRLWPHPQLADRQALRVLLNDVELTIRALRRGPQVIELNAPESAWRAGRNLLVFQFRAAFPAPDNAAPWQGPRPRSAAVDWLEVGRPTNEPPD